MAKAKVKKKSALRSRRQPNGTGRILSSGNAARIERRYQIFVLRRDGYTIREIADIVGACERTVAEDIKAVLSQAVSQDLAETTEEYRQLVVERYEGINKSFIPQTRQQVIEIDDPAKPGQKKTVVIEASVNAANLVLATNDRLRKLLALDVPEIKKVEVTGIREYVGVDMDKV